MLKAVALAALISLFTTFAQAQQTGDTDKNRLTIIFASNPRSEPWKEDLVKSKSVESVKKIADDHRCSVTVDGDDIYVIDEDAFGLTRLKTERAVFAELAKAGVEPFEPLTEKNLPPLAFNYLLQHQIDSPDFKDMYEKGSPSLYLSPSFDVSLTSKGRTVNVMLPAKEPLDKHQELTNMMPSPDSKATRKLPKRERAFAEVGQGLPSIVVTLGGRQRSIYNRTVLASRIMKQTYESIKKATDACQESASYLQSVLMKEQMDSVWANGVPSGAKSGKYDDLTGNTRSFIEANVCNSYQAYGFASKTEALTFLRSSQVNDIMYAMGISWIVSKNGSCVECRSSLVLDRR